MIPHLLLPEDLTGILVPAQISQSRSGRLVPVQALMTGWGIHSRHISVVINRAQAEVYGFAADPANLPEWAGGLAQSDVTR